MATESLNKMNIGDEAPDFNLTGTDDKKHSLEEFSGSEATLIIFMCNHCPYVRAKLNTIIELQEKFKGKNVSIVGINSNDPNYHDEGFENMKKFATERGITFPYLFDETQEVARSYGTTCTPDPFLFDKDMKLVFHGRIDDALSLDVTPTENTMDENINKILNGEKINENFKPSLGCSIKWKDSG